MSSPGFHAKPAAVRVLTALAAVSALLALSALVTACDAGTSQSMTTPGATASAPTGSSDAGRLPRPDHVVVVMMENHAYSSIIGDPSAAYLDSLAAQGASFTRSYAVAHPSEPNYLALFSGSTMGLTDDGCPHTYTGPNLASELIAAGLSFAGYAESMPGDGFTGCTSGEYARKHNPWVNFTNVPASDNLTFADFPSNNYAELPTVSFVIPNLMDDMHDGTIAQGDAWLKANLNGYAQWAKTHNSELIITWDEDDDTSANRIPTIIVGADVRPGTYGEHIDHYNVLRTLEGFYGLPDLGLSAKAAPITDIFN